MRRRHVLNALVYVAAVALHVGGMTGAACMGYLIGSGAELPRWGIFVGSIVNGLAACLGPNLPAITSGWRNRAAAGR